MRGDDRVRHCTHCTKNVYNISALSREEAIKLIEDSGGKLCVRYYTRPDGSIMTNDCGLPMSKRHPTLRPIMAAFTLFGLAALLPAFSRAPEIGFSESSSFPFSEIVNRLLERIGMRSSATMGDPSVPISSGAITGKIALTPTVVLSKPVSKTPVSSTHRKSSKS